MPDIQRILIDEGYLTKTTNITKKIKALIFLPIHSGYVNLMWKELPSK